MLKRKMFIGSVAGLVVLGGAIGVGAASKSDDVNKGKSSNVISIDKAKNIAVNEVGGNVKSIELDKEDGRLIYDVELYHSNMDDDVDLDIDAITGKVLHIDRDDDRDDGYEFERDLESDDDDKYKDTKENQRASISHKQAIEIALNDSPGKVTEAELDDDGYYEIEIKNGRTEIDMKVDAASGKIIKKEIDRDDD